MNSKYLIIGGAILMIMLFSGAGVVVIRTVMEDNYDPLFAERGSLFAWASSCDSQEISTWSCGKPCEQLGGVTDARAFYNSTHQVQGYTAYDSEQNNIIVSFRATRTNLNWLMDADFLKVKYSNCPGCKVHQGFLIAWNDLKESVLSSTRDLVEKYPEATVSVFGHSLGGAIAILGALDIDLYVKSVDYVYTFGQPRVGNQLFSAFFNLNIENTYRLIHDSDPVPHLPMNSWGFVHEGTEVWYNQENTIYEVCALFTDDKSCSNKIKKYNFDDHDYYFGRNIAEECH